MPCGDGFAAIDEESAELGLGGGGHDGFDYLRDGKDGAVVWWAGGHFFMSNNSTDPPNNGAVLVISKIIKAIMSSAAEAKLGAMFINCREEIPARHTLIEMGHPQPRTPVQTDNTTALGVFNNTIDPRRTKAMDMRFHWLHDHIQQHQFWHYWMPGPHNKGDYVAKHHAKIHHMEMQTTYLTPRTIMDALRRMCARARF